MNDKTLFSRNLRKNQTEAEKLLWSKLRSRRFNSLKFRRQQVVGPYIVDFVCFEQKLVIELDGAGHNEDLRKQKDGIRTNWLKKEGFEVLRFWNSEILKDIESTLEAINLTQTLSYKRRGK